MQDLQIDGRYRVVRLLGQGGMGVVYLARQTALDRDVALKVIALQEGGLVSDAVARFEQEMRATARVEHPNTVRLYDSGPTDRGLYLAMEYLPGRTLRQLLDAVGRLPSARVVRIGTQIARALTAAHRERIIHRDLKPENVMLLDQFGEPDFVKVLDFGIARFLDGQTARMTAAGTVVGTPAYMSPEQAQGRDVDERTDLYALGVILYEMLAGRAPLVRDAALSTLMAQVSEPPVPIDTLVVDVPPALAGLVMALLEKARDRRPPSAETVASALAAMAGGITADRPIERVATIPIPSVSGSFPDVATAGSTSVLPSPGGTSLLPSTPRPATGSIPASNQPVRKAPGGKRAARVLIPVLLLATAALVTFRLVAARQLRGATARVEQAERDRHEPPPRGCPVCSLADLRALISVEEGHPGPQSVLAQLERVSGSCARRWTTAARARLSLGDLAGARQDAAQATTLCPTYALAHHLLGNAAMKSGNAEQAAAEWEQAAALEHGFAAPRFNLALAALARKDAATAVALLDQAIAADPSAPNAFLLRGRARLAAGDHPGGIADLKIAVDRAPTDPEAWMLLGLALEGRDDPAARQAFCRARDLGSADAASRCR